MSRVLVIGLVLLGVASSARADAGAVSAVSIQGVDPRIYLRALRPEPRALLELKRQPVDVSVAILEGHAERYLAEPSAYPRQLAPVEIELLREDETRALLEGALAAVAAKRHPRAAALIERWLDHDDARVRAAAAERFGEAGGSLAVVRELSDDPDPRVRVGACLGMGKLRSEAAVDALVQLVKDERDAERQVAALRAIGLATTAPPAGTSDPALQQAAHQAVASKARLALVVLEPKSAAVRAALDDVLARLQ
ncbi:MAG: HEAT repeat domain-containing protein [Deltaproteobacteria bacterium]|nr:HEAT repeat domain-containing protein [Deltaproteobacteria bacterium]